MKNIKYFLEALSRVEKPKILNKLNWNKNAKRINAKNQLNFIQKHLSSI
jgi:hypothetical protein